MRHLALLLVLSIFAAPVFVSQAHAADKGKKAEGTSESVQGKITTEKKDVDDFTAIKLTTAKGEVYHITLDEKGKQLAKQYEGISVFVNGTVETKDKDKWLTVKSVGEKKKKK